ncbi:hypothetical protein A2Z22_03760 [Candidatus Woesebacteria bacterium RBG_16_34_12]|uniref:Uncharacterized protein n=1 Tax=Candidatus Woesebacteria bacterium RBG_16_34_12 TaxID=1802480 RepID=A0A1F7X7A7_9BACT|nr:MAG: hypothetical protein A2Z22_03760 [Candidatus Woesebacteria bacterium RBG_16_34_12]
MTEERKTVDPRVIPELQGFCQKAIDSPADGENAEIPYGHITRIIALGVYGVATRKRGGSFEEQIEAARKVALEQIRIFGPAIVPL